MRRRRFVALFCLAGLLAACGRAQHPEHAAIEAFLDRYFSTWSARDMEGYGACFDPGARVTFVEKNGRSSSQGLTDFLHGQKLGHERSPSSMTEVPVAKKISDDLRAVLSEPALKKRFEDIASYINPMSPAELRDYIRTEQSLWKPVIEQIATFKAAPR